jgi:hypothetical protein
VNSLASVVTPIPSVERIGEPRFRIAPWLLLLASAWIPLSLVWDFSWESTVGVDPVWTLPHTVNYLAIAIAGLTALGLLVVTTRREGPSTGVRLCGLSAPLGAWVVIWGAFAFAAAVLFDRWWQSVYGLAAGLWHPPQIFKAIAFFATVIGAWLFALSRQNNFPSFWSSTAFLVAGALVLALITVVTLTFIYPNRQHSDPFYQIACATYPLVLAAIATAGKLRWPATTASTVYMVVLCLPVWLLPLLAAAPKAAPIYNPMNHLMPPPFPLLLIVPGIALDVVLREFSWRDGYWQPWIQAVVAGFFFFLLFFGTQWAFSEFLLSEAADNWFFAGGGKHWPFFLKINPPARVAFWETPQDQMKLSSALIAAGFAMIAARMGLWLGAWMRRVRR